MSSGIFGSSTTLDHKASQTFLDTGEECLNIEDDAWILIFPENDAEYLDLSGRNLPTGYALMNYTIMESVDDSWNDIASEEIVAEVSGGKSSMKASFDELGVGEYRIEFFVEVYNQSTDLQNASLVENGERISKSIDFELEVNVGDFSHSYHSLIQILIEK